MELRAGYKQTEVGVIPDDWDVKTLGEIGKFKNGINKSNEEFGFGFPFVNLMDVFGKSSISENESFGLINSNDIERKLYDLKKGDVLFIRSSVKPSGVGLTCAIENNLPDIVFSGFIIRYRDNNYLSEGFKKHCFYEERFRNNLIARSTVSANTNINQEALKKLQIPLPPTKSEQTAIANVLSDADALISSLEKLIAKKRNIKHGAMQKLLQPKEGWEVKKLGEVLKIKHGKDQKEVKSENGIYPILGTGGLMGFTNEFLYDKPSVLIGRKGTIDKPQFMKTPFWTVDTLFYSEILKDHDAKFIFYIFNLIDWYSYNEASGVPSLNANTIEKIEKGFPPFQEQTRIATILSDMDTEISALETKLEKYKKVKLGMMQNLLTGKIRLV